MLISQRFNAPEASLRIVPLKPRSLKIHIKASACCLLTEDVSHPLFKPAYHPAVHGCASFPFLCHHFHKRPEKTKGGGGSEMFPNKGILKIFQSPLAGSCMEQFTRQSEGGGSNLQDWSWCEEGRGPWDCTQQHERSHLKLEMGKLRSPVRIQKKLSGAICLCNEQIQHLYFVPEAHR